MTTWTNVARGAVLSLCAATGLATAQVRAVRPEPVPLPILWPKFYEAIDLGRVAEFYSIGCMSRSGSVAITSQSWDPEAQRTTIRAMYPGSSSAFYRIVGQDSWVTGCNSNREFVGAALGIGNVVWDGDWSHSQVLNGTLQAINNQRQVVGSVKDSLDHDTAVVFNTSKIGNDPTVTMRRITAGMATGINDDGLVSITAYTGNPAVRAAALASALSGAIYYPSLPGAVNSWTNGIDNQVHLVGGLEDAGGAWRGFIWHPTEGFTQLLPTWDAQGTMPHSEARSVRSDRTAVGRSSYSTQSAYGTRAAATIWLYAGWPRNLNREASMVNGTTMPQLVDAVGISDSGQILCEGRDANGVRRAVLLRPRVGGRWALIP